MINTLRSTLLFLILTLSCVNLFAQQSLKLGDISKIVFAVQPGGITNDFSSFEIIPEGRVWKCYQTKLIKQTLKEIVNDTTKRLLSNIPLTIVSDLVELVNKPDTAININLFTVDKTEMIKYLDSMQHRPLSPQEKSRVIEGLQSSNLINKAFYRLYHPLFRMGDDRTANFIIITTRKNTQIKILSTNFGFLDYEPWYINGVASYNPNISRIFEFITGDKDYTQKSKKRFFINMDSAISYELFKKIIW